MNKKEMARIIGVDLREMDRIDKDMIPIIAELNRKGYRTLACCQGHFYDEHQSINTFISFKGVYEFPIDIPKYNEKRNTTRMFSYIWQPRPHSVFRGTAIHFRTRKNGSIEVKEAERKQIISDLLKWAKELPALKGYIPDYEDYKEEKKPMKRETKEAEVWYAAYGSNINKARFMEYINRCKDNTPPIEERPIIINHSIYFASESGTWGGKGVAFLDEHESGFTFGKLYRIKRSQFEEIHAMEGSKYSKVIDIEPFYLDGIRVLSFTSEKRREDICRPSDRYLDIIRTGIKETFPDRADEVIDNYFIRCLLNRTDKRVLGAIRTSEHALKNREIPTLAKVYDSLDSVINLYTLGLIKEDSRSINRGLSYTDDEAMLYTVPEKRDLIDRLLMMI